MRVTRIQRARNAVALASAEAALRTISQLMKVRLDATPMIPAIGAKSPVKTAPDHTVNEVPTTMPSALERPALVPAASG